MDVNVTLSRGPAIPGTGKGRDHPHKLNEHHSLIEYET